jgi:hypothetical protein
MDQLHWDILSLLRQELADADRRLISRVPAATIAEASCEKSALQT